MAYDAHADRVILFGGTSYYPVPGRTVTFPASTWAYDFENNSWAPLATTNHPAGRANGQMVYDSGSARVILHGGMDSSWAALSDTWSFDYDNLTWTRLDPANRPRVLELHSMVYDFHADRAVVYGGWDGVDLNGTYAFDLEANAWEEIRVDPSPPACSGAAMAYDGVAGRTILYCPGNQTDSTHAETWSFDYGNRTWGKLATSLTPTSATGATMAYDSKSRRSILFGGAYDTAYDLELGLTGDDRVPLRHTWAFDGATLEWALMDRPPAVASFSATGRTNEVALEWSATPDPDGPRVTGYNVYRGKDMADLHRLAEGWANRTFNDSSAEAGMTYYYAVAATGPAGEGSLSAVLPAAAAAEPAAPTGGIRDGVAAIFSLPDEAGVVIVVAIVLSFFSGAIVNEYGFRIFRKLPRDDEDQ
jgi:hypothetical protein